MEHKELKKLYFKDMTQLSMYQLFGLREVNKIQELEDWLKDLPELSEGEKFVANLYQSVLLENINAWNEQELSLNFIGPIFGAMKFTVKHKLNWFAQRPLSGIIGDYELGGKPDGTIASGYLAPEVTYFSFQSTIVIGIKKDLDSSGDPIGQNLAAMLVGQIQNDSDNVMYGCYIVGRNWYFMVLKGKEFAISKDYSATHEDDMLDIVKILKALRTILLKRLGIDESSLN